ncbi:MAG: hypothetical protein IJM18_00745 [Clostridia bacterium]|nr:hypothetical protein [Clostridia bacterium]
MFEKVKDFFKKLFKKTEETAGTAAEAVKRTADNAEGDLITSLTDNLPIEGELGDQVKNVIGSVRGKLPAGLKPAEIINKIIDAITAKFPLDGPVGDKIKPVVEFLKSKIPQ